MQMQAPPSQANRESPPFGSSPITGATPNRGLEAAALQKVGLLATAASQIISEVGATSEIGRELSTILSKLLKLVPPGTVSNASERDQLQKMLYGNTQRGMQMQQLKQRNAQDAMGGGQKPQGMPNMPGMPQMPKAA